MFWCTLAFLLYRGINDTDSNSEEPSEGACMWSIYFFHNFCNQMLEPGARGRRTQILTPMFPGRNLSSTYRFIHLILIPLKLHLCQQRKHSGWFAFSKEYCNTKMLLRASTSYHTQLKLVSIIEIYHSASLWNRLMLQRAISIHKKYYLAPALLLQILHPHDQVQEVHWCIKTIKAFPRLFSTRCV